MEIVEFKKIVLSNYQQQGRKFPWHFADPWGVMVSEFMKVRQQTPAAAAPTTPGKAPSTALSGKPGAK